MRTRRRRLVLGAGILAVVVAAAGVLVMVFPALIGLGPAEETGGPEFEDVAAASGIHFLHFDASSPRNYILETIGSGLAWIDYDADGWPDLFCVQDGPVIPEPDSPAPTNKLYRNSGDGKFADVTEAVGLGRAGFGMGAAVGDFDNDGFDDLVVTYFRGVVLYHNRPDTTAPGGRRFVDVTKTAGLVNPHWATSCAWGDIDGDGRLDLYVCNYCEVDLANYPSCDRGGRTPFMCPPFMFPTTPHRLFRNNGNGTFTDITVAAGLTAGPAAPGLGVVMTDVDGDGRLDIYAANDMRPSYLFHNQGGGRFVEVALSSGCAVSPTGTMIAGMGVDAGDVDGSGRPSVFVANFQDAPNVLFRNAGGLRFEDWTMRSGLGPASMNRLGFGTVFCDFDLDGRLDVVVANGHVDRYAAGGDGNPLFAQEAQLFVGRGDGRFRDASATAGRYFQEKRVGRGLAWADYDNDGRPDLAINHNGGPLALLRNRSDTANNWVRLELIGDGRASNRNAVGARVEIEAGGVTQVRFVNGGGSYLSASERRLLVGLGQAERVDRVTVRWPSGREETHRDLAARTWWQLREGITAPESARPPAAKP